MYTIEKKSLENDNWSSLKAAVVMLSSISAFLLGLLWLGPYVSKLPQVRILFDLLCKGSALAIRILAATLTFIANIVIIVIIESHFSEVQRKVSLKKLRRRDLEKIWSSIKLSKN